MWGLLCYLINTVSMNPTDVFTRRKGPAELSLHSSISFCLTFASGQQLGSVDSNGSITYTPPTHTHTNTQVTGKTIQRGDDWWSVYEKHTAMCNDNRPGGAFVTWAILSSHWSHMLLKEMEQCAGWTLHWSHITAAHPHFFESNSIRQSWKELAFAGIALRE